MEKRMTLLARRGDMSVEEFSHHWLNTHAELVRRMPMVNRYVQNLVLRRLLCGLNVADPFSIDGIVELWFADTPALAAAFASEAARELPIDECNFIRGITIFPVLETELAKAGCATQVMMVARVDGGEIASQIEPLALAASRCGGGLITMNHLGPPVWREHMWHEPKAPNFILKVELASPAQAPLFGRQREVVEAHSRIVDGGGLLECYVVYPRRII